MLAHARIDGYEIKDVLGQGGMGIVFRAYDPNRKGFVALKTMRDAADPAALALFNQEWRTLANLSHPNIVDVLNSGAFDDDGQKKPYFVMPLLPGKTLDKLIKESGHLLTVDRVVEILVQTCRGLQAAHSSGLVHRDLKPSNLFVLSDDSVKIIDFGMVHLADSAKSVTGIKGTLHYIAPEQLEMKEVTPATDIFSLGVVAYEALTGRKPFERPTERAVFEAIRREFPPPASELNPAVNKVLAQVVAKAMAKNPWNRFASAREFSEYLQRALNGQPIDAFDVTRLQPRLERARKALAESNFEYAHEILNELQLEGHLDAEIKHLLDQVREGSRTKVIRQLLDSAQTRLQEEEFPLAWQKIQEALQRDPGNTEALALQAEIETRGSDQQIEKWRRLVHQHLHNNAFTQARHAIAEIRKIRADDPSVQELLQVADRRQAEYQKACEEKEQQFQSAMRVYGSGEISAALSKLEKIFAIDSRAAGLSLPGRGEVYRETYEKIRSEWETVQHAVTEIERVVAGGDLARASEISAEQCEKYPNDLGLQALRLRVEDLIRQEKSAYIAEMGRRVEAEPDLNRRVQYLEEALARYPNEPHFEELASSLRKRRDLVDSIVAKARQCEEQGLLNEALGQWTTLRNIYPQYAGLNFELDRVLAGCDLQKRREAKLEWVRKIDQLIEAGEYERAYGLAVEALESSSADQELQTLKRLAQEGRDRSSEALTLAEQAQGLTAERRYDEAIQALRQAASLDPHNPVIRARLADTLAARAQGVLASDWRTSESLVQEALRVSPDHVLAKNLRPSILLAKRAEFIERCASEARGLQASGELSAALDKIQQGLVTYPNDGRLVQLQNTLREQLRTRRDRDFEELKQAAVKVDQAPDQSSLTVLLDRSVRVSKLYAGDEEMAAMAFEIEQKARAAALAQTRVFPTPPVARPPVTATAPDASPRTADADSKAVLQKDATFRFQTLFARARAWFEPARSRFGHLSRYQRAAVLSFPLIVLAVLIFIAVRPAAKPGPTGPAGPPDTKVAVTINPNVDGAAVAIDGAVIHGPVAQLAQGAHQLTATRLGYKPIRQTLTVGANPFTSKLALEPEPQTIQISADVPTGTVLLDDKEIGTLQSGNFSYNLPGEGRHTVKVVDGKKDILAVEFEAKAGEPARLVRAPYSHDLPVAVVSRLGPKAMIQSSVPGMKVALKNGATEVLPAEGRNFTLQADDSEITIDMANQPVTLAIEAGNAPLLTVRAGISNKGTLAVEANIAEAEVYIDGRKSARRLQNGKWFGQFEAGEHRIAVVQDGYERKPEQKVMIPAGKRTPVRFELTRAITTAFLRIEGGTPDAEILVDGGPVGKVGADGNFGPVEVRPDVEHAIRLLKDDHEPAELKRRAATKGTVLISGSDARLKPFGTLDFSLEPSDAAVTIHRKGEAARRVSTAVLRLPEGTYTVSASADAARYGSFEQEVQVSSGKSTAVKVVVPKKAEAPLPAATKRLDVSDHFLAKNWAKQEDGFWFHDGPAPISQAHFQLVLDARRIKRPFNRQEKILWRTFIKGEDYIEFEVDGSNYSRRQVVNGRAAPATTQPHGAGKPEYYRLSITVEPQRISIKIGNVADVINVGVEGRTSFYGKVALRLAQ